jgi:hypothetical protein
MNKKIDLILILMLVITICFPTAYGDGGIISPPQIYIQERAQNAIVAWNGTEEVLILSIDIDSSESTRVLRIIPLPSNPTEVKEGSFDSFTTLQNIINKKLQDIYNFSHLGKENGDYGAGGAQSNIVEITFQETIGAHNVTIFKILDSTNFTDYATDFAHSMGLTDITFSSSFQSTVNDYLQDNISYFVFDIIDTTEEEHSINPIIYRFKTDFLYYPLKITAASDVGETYANVNVFCLAKNRIKEEIFTDLSFYSNIGYYRYYDFLRDINLTEDELLEIALAAGADDMENTGTVYEITCDPSAYEKLKKNLKDKDIPTEIAEISMVPQNTVPVTDEHTARRIISLLEALDDHEDVQNTFSNFDIPNDVISSISSG